MMMMMMEPANYDEISMRQSIRFSDSLKDLKNLRAQLYSAADYFETSYKNDNQKQIVLNAVKDYATKAVVSTVDHLGSMTFRVNDILNNKIDELSGTDLRISCIQQRVENCQKFIDDEGLFQQSFQMSAPKYHKRYILPVGERIDVGIRFKSKYEGCSLDDEDDWHQLRNAVRASIAETQQPSSVRMVPSSLPLPSPSRSIRQPGMFTFMGSVSSRELEKRAVSPQYRFPLLRHGSLSSRSTTPNSSRPTTPNPSRPITPNSRKPRGPSEPLKSVSMRLNPEMDGSYEQIPSKSKRLLKALLSRRKSKKDDTLYAYLDEYS
ncbi:protein ABIL2-like [Impatiens glandulifera]|uniref:protein ABIL2-like n=1 Tax=Impatiens glandulifera TaxID=253017 RepID=UPI001FB174E8|nr:protein ABIL2-like [Impatiens glandulifera]XP_047322988.1 protein ABIL2-like [Impatiens glandulifera]